MLCFKIEEGGTQDASSIVKHLFKEPFVTNGLRIYHISGKRIGCSKRRIYVYGCKHSRGKYFLLFSLPYYSVKKPCCLIYWWMTFLGKYNIRTMINFVSWIYCKIKTKKWRAIFITSLVSGNGVISLEMIFVYLYTLTWLLSNTI